MTELYEITIPVSGTFRTFEEIRIWDWFSENNISPMMLKDDIQTLTFGFYDKGEAMLFKIMFG